jgi:hypothetical protein
MCFHRLLLWRRGFPTSKLKLSTKILKRNMYFFNKFIRNKFLLEHKYSLQSINRSVGSSHEVSTTAASAGSVPQILPPRMHAVESARRAGVSIRPIWNGYFVKVRSAVLVSLSVIIHLGLRIVGGVFSGRYFNPTLDRGVQHVRQHVYYTVYTSKPSVEQFHTGPGPHNQNSTSTVGAGLESFKNLLPTRMTSSKK